MVSGEAVLTGSRETLRITPNRPIEFVTEPFAETEILSGTLYDFVVNADSFAHSLARVSYSFETSGSAITFRFSSDDFVPIQIIPGIVVGGLHHFSGTLTAPYNESRVIQSQTFQSLLSTNVFTGWAGLDTVEYSFSPRGVTADLQSGTGVNAFGGADTFVGIENLVGSSFDDTLAGDAGNNLFIGGFGNDTISGREGLDLAEFPNARIAYAIAIAGETATVTGPQGTDTLDAVERLHFLDRKLALDLNAGEAAGNTARIIGAAFDTQNITLELAGEGIAIFDAGAGTLQVCELALGTPLFLSLAGSRSNPDFVDTVYSNIVGVLPDAAERAFLVSLLQGSGGTMTQAELLMLAASLPANEANIDLIGLQQSGLEFV